MQDSGDIQILALTRSQRLYLAGIAAGFDPEDVCEKIPNERRRDPKTGKKCLGIQVETVSQWRIRSAMFAEAERRTLADPLWAHDTIANPMRIAANDFRDLEYLLGDEFRGFSAKKVELALTEMGRIGGETNISDVLKGIMQKARLTRQLPQETRDLIDVTPAEAVHDRLSQ